MKWKSELLLQNLFMAEGKFRAHLKLGDRVYPVEVTIKFLSSDLPPAFRKKIEED